MLETEGLNGHFRENPADGVNLIRSPGHLNRDAALAEVDGITIQCLGQLKHLAAHVRLTVDLYECEFAMNDIVVCPVRSMHNVHKLVELFGYLLQYLIVAINDYWHTRLGRIKCLSDGEAVNVEAPAAEQSRNTGEYAESILYKYRYDVFHRDSPSFQLFEHTF